jgi:DNA-binding transcriptional LysR family regulator
MGEIDFRTLNLNLVPALEALLHERAVGRAAARMGVSQSAMSHSLAKLREALGDPLLVPKGRAMTLSPRARELAGSLPAALEQLRSTLAGPERFDPKTAELTFSIASVDYFELTSLPHLLEYLGEHAPGIRLSLHRLTADSAEQLADGELDLVLGGTGLVRGAGIRGVELYRDPFRVIVRADHPTVRRRPTLQTYLEQVHIVVRFEGRGQGLVDRVLAKQGRVRQVGLWVPHFVSAPLAVAQSDMISTIASGIAERGRELLGLRVYPPPLELPPAPIMMWWARAHDTDPARTWLRDVIRSGRASPPGLRKLMA